MFPFNPNFDLRFKHSEKYQVKFAHNNMLMFSSIPALQRMLNEDYKIKQRASRKLFLVTFLGFVTLKRYILSNKNSLSL